MSASNPDLSITFHLYQQGQKVRSETLCQSIIKIGKLPSSHLRIDDGRVSRMHAVIEVNAQGEMSIIDLGSATGTSVNGRRVNRAKLASKDEITVGNTRIVVEVGAAERPAVAPVPPAAPPPAPSRVAAAKPAVPAVGAVEETGMTQVTPPPSFASMFGSAGKQTQAAATEKVQYGIVASGPPVDAREVETADAAVEVMVMWGENNVLHVEHLVPPRDYVLGEAGGMDEHVDYLMGSEVLGVKRLTLVKKSETGIGVVLPQGCQAEVTQKGQMALNVESPGVRERLQSFAELPGARLFPLADGDSVKITLGEFVLWVKSVHAGKKIAGTSKVEKRPLFYVGGSMLLHLLFLLLFYFLPPRPAALSLDVLNTDSRLVKYLMEPEEEDKPPPTMTKADGESGGSGEQHKGESGQMGKEGAEKSNNRYAVKGPSDNTDPHMAREAMKEQARNAGILGTLRAMAGSWDSPTSPFGRDTASGNDPMSALGALMGSQIGENVGFGGLGMRGAGRGGGGTGEGTIGLGGMGTMGHGRGGGAGSGYGRGAGNFSGRQNRVPKIRGGAVQSVGSLSKETIRRVVRRHLNEVKHCYEQQLNQRPDLAGRVTISFIISPTGAVQSSTVASSTIGNRQVETCVASAVRRWAFPAPDGGGIVVVNYPFMLSAAGG
ncbi:MAG: TonB family protein [Polyangiales bacterium]